MVNLRQQNFVSFRLKEFDADLGTGSYNEALTVYNGVVTKLLPNLTNEELNATFDPVKDDLQNKINTAITNTYVPPNIPGPDLTKYRGLKYPLQDPNDYPIILDALKQSNTAFRAAFNGELREMTLGSPLTPVSLQQGENDRVRLGHVRMLQRVSSMSLVSQQNC